jgi:hypothetical protein
MRSTTLLTSLLAVAYVSAQEIQNDDIPPECSTQCAPIVQLADRCE